MCFPCVPQGATLQPQRHAPFLYFCRVVHLILGRRRSSVFLVSLPHLTSLFSPFLFLFSSALSFTPNSYHVAMSCFVVLLRLQVSLCSMVVSSALFVALVFWGSYLMLLRDPYLLSFSFYYLSISTILSLYICGYIHLSLYPHTSISALFPPLHFLSLNALSFCFSFSVLFLWSVRWRLRWKLRSLRRQQRAAPRPSPVL